MGRLAGSMLVALACAGAPSAWAQPADDPVDPPASAAPEHRLVWREDWPRFHGVEYGVTAALWYELAVLEWLVEPPNTPSWTGGILFDDAARDGLAGRSLAVRETAGAVSDPITLGLQIYVMTVDSVLVPLLFDDWNWDVAWQMTMMNLEALAASFFLVRTASYSIARERPSAADCRQDPDYEPHCSSGPNISFPSGHTAGAFLGAGLMCAHHLYQPLYGGGAPEVAACVLPSVLATTDGLLRVVADRHYVTDVLVGAGIGFGIGYGLPVLLHYGRGQTAPDQASDAGVRWTLLPTAGQDQLGLALHGSM